MEPFSAAYMHLHVWHAADSSVESEDKLNSSRLIFVNISEMSDMIPVVAQHPILLDVATKETMTRTGEPMAPLYFRGFRLHTVWTEQPGGDLVRQIALPCFLGKGASPMLDYESEKFPQGLMQGPKMVINLRLPSDDHWNIASDLILPLAMDTFRQRHEAKQTAQGLEGESEGAKVSPTEASAPGEYPWVEVGGSDEALPKRITLPKERVLETTQEILACIHTLHIQAMHEMGSICELDRTLARTLLAESARVQLIIGEDLTKSLMTLRADLEASSEVLLSDIAKTLDLHPNNPASCQVKAILQRFQQTTSLKVNLSLMILHVAQDDIEGFLQSRLQEISWELMEGLTRKLLAHTSRVQELVRVPKLAEEEVSHRVLVGLAIDQHLKANFFPGILEGVAGRLGLAPPGVPNPSTSAGAGVSRQWAVALREAVMKMAGRDIDLEQVAHNVLPPGLHLDYNLDFQTRRFDDIAPTLTPHLLSGLVGNICQLEKPEIPGRPTSLKAEEGLWGHGGAPTKPDAPGPSRNGGMVPQMQTGEVEAKENKQHEQEENDPDQTLLEPDPEEVAAVMISDDDEADLPIDMPQAASTPKSEPVLSQKHPLEDRSPCSSPPKKRATEEEERSTPPQEAALPRGVTEEDILPKRYKTFAVDNGWVQHVRCSLLGLKPGTMPSRKDIDTSEHFISQVVALESDLPEVITDHWLPSSGRKASS